MAKNELRCVFLSLIALAGSLPSQGVDDLVRDGKAKALRREFRAALGPLDAALARSPENAEALRWRGHCRNALSMHEQALADYDKAIRIDPKNAWSFYARGMAKHHLGRAAAAIADYTKSLELDPTNHKAVEWRGYNRARSGDPLGAYLDFTRALRLDPENPWVFHARGRAASDLGSYARAKDDFESARLLDPKDAANHAQLGFLLVAMGDDAGALASLDRAFELEPHRHEYARLWRYWLRSKLRKLGPNAADSLPRKKWEGDLAKVLLGEMTRARLLTKLSIYDVSADELRARRCEAAFYLGLRASMDGKPHRAREQFRDALARGDASMPEWRAARRLAK